MKIIGLTGSFGSGKSIVAEELKKLGAKVIDADKISHELMEKGKPLFSPIVKEFGKEILKADGSIDRKALGAIVFSDPMRLRKLDEITHPSIMKEVEKRIAAHRASGMKEPLVLNAPLLIEVGHHKLMDKIIVVFADELKRFKRVADRDGMSPQRAREIDLAQMPQDKKKTYADFLIDNNGETESTLKQVREIYKKISSNDGAQKTC